MSTKPVCFKAFFVFEVVDQQEGDAPESQSAPNEMRLSEMDALPHGCKSGVSAPGSSKQ